MQLSLKFRNGRLAPQLAIYVILFSSLIAVFITAFELGTEYYRDIRGIDSRMQQIQDAYLDSVTENVWVADKERIDTLLVGITRLPDFIMAEIRVDGKTYLRKGEKLSGSGITRSFPLLRMHRDSLQNIGELVVSASYESAYARVFNRLLFFLTANGAKTFLVAIFILLAFYHLVGRHIEEIASRVQRFNLDSVFVPMRLSRKNFGPEDEIQKVEDSYNEMAQRLLSYHEAVRVREMELSRLNVDLELKSTDLQTTSEALRHANIDLEERVELRTAELKGRETQLRKLSRAIDQSPNMIFITDLNGVIEYVNPKFSELSGYSAADAIGQTPRILKSGETPPEAYKALWTTITSGHEWRGELKDRNKNGQVFWASVLISPVRNEDGAITHFISTHEDITERRRNEDLAKREHSLRQSVIESLPGIFFVIDDGGRFVMWNHNVEVVTGFSTEEISKATPSQFFEGEDRVLIEASMAKVFKDGKATTEATLISKDGHQTPFYFSGIRFNLDGRQCIVGTGIDITERLAAESAASDARSQAEIANRTKTDFLANMSHELRTPLNAIIGFSDIMKNESFGQLGNPKYKDYAEDINRSGLMLLELISDILDVSAIEAGKLVLYETDLDIPEVIESVVRLVGPRIDSIGERLIVTVPDFLPKLRADSRRVKQILLNLLTNAAKYSSKGDTITIAVTSNQNGALSISISDTGPGMSEDEIKQAMMPFGRTKHAYVREIEGTGLGLPLCNSLIVAHGGTLDIQSTPGIGTTVRVHFPLERIIRTYPPPD